MINRRLLIFFLAVEVTILGVTGLQIVAHSPRPAGDALWLLPPLAYSFLGTLVVWRRPDNLIGWIYLMPVGFLGLLLLGRLAETMEDWSGLSNLVTVLQVLASLGWIGFFGTMFTLVWLYFPDGHLPSSHWRIVLWMVIFGTPLATMTDFLGARPDLLQNPLLAFIRSLSGLGDFLLPGASLASFTSLIYRYSRGSAKERQQIRWIVSAAAIPASSLVISMVIEFLFYETPVRYAAELILPLSITLVPVASGIAILRYRLFDLDLIIRKTLVYGLLTGLLAILFFGAVAGLQNLLTAGAGPRSQIATVLSTLLIAALFYPLRRRVQAFIDRSFYRQRYDAERTLAGFSAVLRSEVDLSALSAQLVAVVQDSMQPTLVTLWLATPEEKEKNGRTPIQAFR